MKYNKWDIIWNLEIISDHIKDWKYYRYICKCIKCWREINKRSYMFTRTKTWCRCTNSWWSVQKIPKYNKLERKLFSIYINAKARCNNKNVKDYRNYWKRWIKMEWKTFELFLKDMKDTYAEWLQLWRKNIDWNYSKENCEWIERKEIQRRKNTKFIFNWIRLSKILEDRNILPWTNLYRSVYWRLNIWFSLEDAINKPIRKNKRRLNINPA